MALRICRVRFGTLITQAHCIFSSLAHEESIIWSLAGTKRGYLLLVLARTWAWEWKDWDLSGRKRKSKAQKQLEGAEILKAAYTLSNYQAPSTHSWSADDSVDCSILCLNKMSTNWAVFFLKDSISWMKAYNKIKEKKRKWFEIIALKRPPGKMDSTDVIGPFFSSSTSLLSIWVKKSHSILRLKHIKVWIPPMNAFMNHIWLHLSSIRTKNIF